MLNTMFDKVLLGLLAIAVSIAIYFSLSSHYYKYDRDKEKLRADASAVLVEIKQTENNLTGIAKYAEGVIETIDEEVEYEKNIGYGYDRDLF